MRVELARLAWHLGNRHTDVQMVGERLRIRRDHVLEEMLDGLGAHLTPIEAPFDPEVGRRIVFITGTIMARKRAMSIAPELPPNCREPGHPTRSTCRSRRNALRLVRGSRASENRWTAPRRSTG